MEDTTYKCECGSIIWDGVEYPLVAAHYIIPNPENFESRIYYVSAEVSNEYGEKVRNINFRMAVDTVSFGGGFIDITDPEIGSIDHLMEDVDFDNPLAPVRSYMATLGQYEIDPALFGGMETVNWTFTVREIINGNMVGFPKELKGNLIVNIED